MVRKLLITYFLFFTIPFAISAQSGSGVTIIDSRHYSNTFGEVRNYRIFLPPGYYDKSEKRYPVIYFFHGWSQRSFGDGGYRYAEFDKGNDNNGDNIAKFVSTHEVIVVKWDGFNRDVDEKYYFRPYNVDPVETHRQFPIYFPELVNHIDAQYRTIADREHRGVSGLSMGGFMTFWIAGKYPDMLCAAGSFCGSPEFIVGPKTMPVEYRHLDMYKNYGGVNLRLHYGDKDFIRSYHQDMDRIWPRIMDNYHSKVFDAEHSTCGLGEMFDFILNSMNHPLARPGRWDHIDAFPEFSIWGWQISSDRIVPGFTILEKVDGGGFRSAVREFVPDGELLSFVNLTITSAPIFEKNQFYIINDIDLRTAKTTQRTIKSDGRGRLQFHIDGSLHEIGINRKGGKANLSIAAVEVNNMSWAKNRKVVECSIRLVNKGMSTAKNVRAQIFATTSDVKVVNHVSEYGNIGINEQKTGNGVVSFQVRADTVEIERFSLIIQDENNFTWTGSFVLPLKKDVAEIKEFEIADGKIFTVVKSGIFLDTLMLGTGNGDGIANPGESVVILVKDHDKYWRTNLTFSDKYVNPFGFNKRMSDDWTEFDHVGASAKYNIPVISSDCPEDHPINFFAEYWTPEYPFHIIKQGVINIRVKGKDQTPPIVDWAKIPGDNVLQVKIRDGSKINLVKARLILKEDTTKTFEVELRDEAIDGDRAAGDNVFSKKIPDRGFGIYRLIIEATDAFNNKATVEVESDFVLH